VTHNNYLLFFSLFDKTHVEATAIWLIALASIFCMLLRPRGIAEVYWVGVGALILVLTRLLPFTTAAHAVREGADVYLFLTGMMLLAELARCEGVFDWLADLATHHARGSATRLFLLIYGVGVIVTVFLSNDATAVVLTPAVFAAVRRAKARPLPYLLACALIANAASFVLPISNPANLVVYGKRLPHLAEWLRIFALPSAVSILATLGVLWRLSRASLAAPLKGIASANELSPAGRFAACGLLFAAVALMAASALGFDLGLPTCAAAALVVATIGLKDRRAPLQVVRSVSWSVLPLVAGLFVIVEALNRAGMLAMSAKALSFVAQMRPALARLTAAFGVGLISNVMNNLPVGLASGVALQQSDVPANVAHAVLIGVDLGPNLSVTGSLATILWLIALRREGLQIGAWEFLKIGLLAMPFALLLSVLTVGIF
jgi:arsenical pump membrane protein